MATTKRKSFAKALDQKVAEIPQTTGETATEAKETKTATKQTKPQPAPQDQPEQVPVKFNKFTFPLRADLHRQLSKTVARLNLEQDIELSMSILIRLGIENVLARLEKNPDTLLKELHKLEQKEVSLSGDKKYTVSRGLEEYIQNAGGK